MHLKGLAVVIILWRMAKFQPADPCDTYESINDTTLNIAYTAANINSTTCQSIHSFRWYRYTGTDDGLMTEHCPQGLQCGSSSQIWFNDSLPFVEDNVIPKTVCIHDGISCCQYKAAIKMKNCTDFMVYFLIPVPVCTNFCFKALSDSSSRSDRNDGVPFWTWIIITIVLLLIVICIFFIIGYKIKRVDKNKITNGFEGVVFKSEQASRQQFDCNKLTFNSKVYNT